MSGKKGSLFVGGILGSYDNAAVNSIGKYFVYDNYSTTSPPLRQSPDFVGALLGTRNKGQLHQLKELPEAFKQILDLFQQA